MLHSRMIIKASFVLALIFLSGCGNRAAELNEKGLANLQRGNMAEAISLLEEASRLAPGKYEIAYNLAEAYRRQGRLDDALKTIETAVSLSPRRPSVLVARAKIQLALGEAQQALADLEALDASLLRQPELLFYHALALLENQQNEEAIEQLEQFVRLKPKAATGQAALGLAYLRAGRSTEGRSALEKAVQLEPDLVDARLYLAQYHLSHSRDFHQAKEEIYTARRLDPNNAEVYILLGQTNLAMQLLSEADRAFEDAIRLNPDAWKAYLGLAESAMQRGNTEQALTYVRRAEDKASQHYSIYNLLGRLYTQRNQSTLAKQAYMRSLQLNPNQPDILETVQRL